MIFWYFCQKYHVYDSIWECINIMSELDTTNRQNLYFSKSVGVILGRILSRPWTNFEVWNFENLYIFGFSYCVLSTYKLFNNFFIPIWFTHGLLKIRPNMTPTDFEKCRFCIFVGSSSDIMFMYSHILSHMWVRRWFDERIRA